MFSLSKPDVILTHESDLDGFISGLLLQRLAQRLFQTKVPLETHHYDAWRQRPMQEPVAWVCDFSFDPRMDRPHWLVVDHHPTTTQPQRAILVHDLAKSASLLCYQLCQQHGLDSPTLDRLVHLSHVADLFLHEDPDFELAIDYASLVKVYQFWNLHALLQGDLEKLLDHPLLEVMAVKRRVEDPIGLAWSKANIIEITAGVAYVDTIIGNSNLIVHRLLQDQATPFAVLITLMRKGNNSMVASLRSRNGEALKIAQRLQGGGHANAAGATLPRSLQRVPDALDYLRKVLNPAPPQIQPIQSLENLFEDLELKK